MPTPCYVSIQGETQKNITENAFTPESVGNIYVEGHENEMMVQEFKHNVTIPTDPQSGQPTGQRVHKPFIMTVALNSAIPKLYNSLVTGEMLTDVELRWYRTSTSGHQEHFFTTTLKDAIVVDIDFHMPHCQDPNNGEFTQLIDISLSYREIFWKHDAASTEGHDDWRKPIES